MFQKVFFHNKWLFYVKFNGDFKYVDDLEYKLNLTYLQLCLALCTMTKNPKSIIWDILAIFNIYMDIKGSFCREFEYLPYFLYYFRKIYSLGKKFQK